MKRLFYVFLFAATAAAQTMGTTGTMGAGTLYLTNELATIYGGIGGGGYIANVTDTNFAGGAVAGGADCTAAFVAASEYLRTNFGGGTIVFPASTNAYYGNFPLTNACVSIEGLGRPWWAPTGGGGTVLKAYDSQLPVVQMGDDTALLAGPTIRNLIFNGGGTNACGLFILGCADAYVDSCMFVGFTNGVVVTGGTNAYTSWTLFHRSRFTAPGLGANSRAVKVFAPRGGEKWTTDTMFNVCRFSGAASGYIGELDGASVGMLGGYQDLNYSGHGWLWQTNDLAATNAFTVAAYANGFGIKADSFGFDPTGWRTNVGFTVLCETNITSLGKYLLGRALWNSAVADAANNIISLTDPNTHAYARLLVGPGGYLHDPLIVGRVLIQPSNSWSYAASNYLGMSTAGLITLTNAHGNVQIGSTGDLLLYPGGNDVYFYGASPVFRLWDTTSGSQFTIRNDAGVCAISWPTNFWGYSGGYGGTPRLVMTDWYSKFANASGTKYIWLDSAGLGVHCVPTNAVDVVGSGVVTGGLGIGTNAPSAGVQIMGNPTGLAWSLNGVQGVCSNGLWGFGVAPDSSYRVKISGSAYASSTLLASSLAAYPGTSSLTNSPNRALTLDAGISTGYYYTNGFGTRVQFMVENGTPSYALTNGVLDCIMVDAVSNAPISAMTFAVNNGSRAFTETMRIVGDKVGVGTNTPSTALHVVGIATVSSNVVAGGVFSSGGNAGKSVTNTWYSVSSDLLTVVTNVQKIHGGLMTSWTVGGVETMVAP
jgi:hypothetical protein